MRPRNNPRNETSKNANPGRELRTRKPRVEKKKAMPSENIVKLNIGGTIFHTSKSTLAKFDGLLKTMMETGIPVKKDESGCIFIDRDATHFRSILNFMRDGEVELPDSEKEVKEIQKEAQFYLLDSLVELCTSKFPAKGIRVIKSDAEYLEIVLNRARRTIIFKCPTGVELVPLDIKSFLEKYGNQMDIYFKPYQVDALHPSTGWRYEIIPDNDVPRGNPGFAEPQRANPPMTFLESLEKRLDFHFPVREEEEGVEQ